MNIVLFLMLITALSCAMLGPIVVLNKMAMSADAISHSVLLGIVLAYMATKTLNSVSLVIFATLFGILTLFLSNILKKHTIYSYHDALGIVYPLFFSIAVILISKYLKNSLIDVEIVLMGNPLFASMVYIGQWNKAILLNVISFLVNTIYVCTNYESLKILLFDSNTAKLYGIPTKLHTHMIEFCICFTCVCAFESVGGILVISYLVASATISYLFSRNFITMIVFSLFVSQIVTFCSFQLAILFNISIPGTTSFIMMVICIVSIFFCKKRILS